MNTVSFDLTNCDAGELAALRTIFRNREGRCLHLTGAVPEEYVSGLEAEAESYAVEGRKIDAEIARKEVQSEARRAHYEGLIAKRRIRDARALRPALARW